MPPQDGYEWANMAASAAPAVSSPSSSSSSPPDTDTATTTSQLMAMMMDQSRDPNSSSVNAGVDPYMAFAANANEQHKYNAQYNMPVPAMPTAAMTLNAAAMVVPVSIPAPLTRQKRPVMHISQFPVEPHVEKVSRHIRVLFQGREIVETTDVYWVLQQHRPPEYYVPRAAIKVPMKATGYRLSDKWKGTQSHYAILDVDGSILANRLWSLEEPTSPCRVLYDRVSFYARPWQCYVDGEPVVPQRSDHSGGWVTSDIEGAFDPKFV